MMVIAPPRTQQYGVSSGPAGLLFELRQHGNHLTPLWMMVPLFTPRLFGLGELAQSRERYYLGAIRVSRLLNLQLRQTWSM
jgi:hypothetical protein